MHFQKKLLFLVCMIFTCNLFAAGKTQEVEIPRTAYKDTYKYYLLEATKKATIFDVTYKRLSFDTILYGKAQINCPSRYIRNLGVHAKSAKDILINEKAPWYQPTIGSIESDIITYVCR